MCFCNEPASQFIEISEKFADSGSLFFANLSQFRNDILNIIWDILFYILGGFSGLSFWIVIKRMIEASGHFEKRFGWVDIFTEIEIIDLVNIPFVHVSFQKNIQNFFTRADPHLSESSQELMFGHMLIFRNIKILEHRF